MPSQLRAIAALLVMVAWNATAESAEKAQAGAIVQSGYERFIDSCALCHGLGARGDGEAAGMLEKAPPDLTQLSKNNEGRFPLEYVYTTIDGRAAMQPHGNREMPVWGNLWTRSVPPEYAEAYARSRALELIMFLESIQE